MFLSPFLFPASLGPNKFVADVIFMLDSSSRVTPEDFLKEKEFVKLIARYLNITPGKSRGSVIIFSTAANAILPFSGYTTMSEFNAVIDRASQLSGNRRLDRAFGVAATLFQNARPDVLKVGFSVCLMECRLFHCKTFFTLKKLRCTGVRLKDYEILSRLLSY